MVASDERGTAAVGHSLAYHAPRYSLRDSCEAAHTLDKTHGEPVGGYYAEPYLRDLNPGVNSCVK